MPMADVLVGRAQQPGRTLMHNTSCSNTASKDKRMTGENCVGWTAANMNPQLNFRDTKEGCIVEKLLHPSKELIAES